MIFDPIDPLFHSSYIFMTPHFYKTLDPIGSNFLLHAEPGYQTFGEVPSPQYTAHLDSQCPSRIYLFITDYIADQLLQP